MPSSSSSSSLCSHPSVCQATQSSTSSSGTTFPTPTSITASKTPLHIDNISQTAPSIIVIMRPTLFLLSVVVALVSTTFAAQAGPVKQRRNAIGMSRLPARRQHISNDMSSFRLREGCRTSRQTPSIHPSRNPETYCVVHGCRGF